MEASCISRRELQNLHRGFDSFRRLSVVSWVIANTCLTASRIDCRDWSLLRCSLCPETSVHYVLSSHTAVASEASKFGDRRVVRQRSNKTFTVRLVISLAIEQCGHGSSG